MTETELEAIGCQKIHWNPNWNGGWFEFWLPIEKCEDGSPYKYLSVRFDKDPRYGRDWMVYIVAPSVAIALKGIETVEEFKQLHSLLEVSVSNRGKR